MKRYEAPQLEEDRELECWRAQGKSMLPSIPPKSRLALGCCKKTRIGEIVCFLDIGGRFVAHRIVGYREVEGKTLLEVRGDAQSEVQVVDPCAVVGVVEEVRIGPASYRAGGFFGRTVRWLAIQNPVLLRVLGRAIGGIWARLGEVKAKYKP